MRAALMTGFKEIVDEMSANFGVQIIQQRADRDHISILFSSRQR
jgi:hypothetical protein